MLIEMMKLGSKTVSAVYLGATRVWRYVFTRTEQTCTDWEDSYSSENVDCDSDELILDDEKMVVFTEVGETTWTVPHGITNVNVLVVAGGGGGGRYGGAGAGGLIYKPNHSVTPLEEISLTIGAGGTGTTTKGNAGQNSIFDNLTAIGGAGGGSRDGSTDNGGSGAGAGGLGGTPSLGVQSLQAGESGLFGFGNDGAGGNFELGRTGGGGGGANANGTTNSQFLAGNGGNGKYYGDIFGDEYGVDGYFAGGGGGGAFNDGLYSVGLGGLGGGQNGSKTTNASHAPNNSGGAGGGGGFDGSARSGSNGGSGIVIIKYTQKTGTRISKPLLIGDVYGSSIEWDSTEPSGENKNDNVGPDIGGSVNRFQWGMEFTVDFKNYSEIIFNTADIRTGNGTFSQLFEIRKAIGNPETTNVSDWELIDSVTINFIAGTNIIIGQELDLKISRENGNGTYWIGKLNTGIDNSEGFYRIAPYEEFPVTDEYGVLSFYQGRQSPTTPALGWYTFFNMSITFVGGQTNTKISTGVSDNDTTLPTFTEVEQGGEILKATDTPIDQTDKGKYLFVKQTLETDDIEITPRLDKLITKL